jgi:aminopeptidase N
VIGLTAHPAFDARTPNRLRALVSSFSYFNPEVFHDPSGGGYRFLADQILAVDRFNPNVAARLIEPLGGFRRFKPDLAGKMKAELERILEGGGLSKNVQELASRALA